MRKSLLIVDDDTSVREALKAVLEPLGYEVVLAADGVEAQDKLRSHRADLIVLDLNMPKRDGWDVLEDVQDLQPGVPVIVITGLWDQLATHCLQGASLIMSKPFEAEALLERIERLLAGAPQEGACAEHITSPEGTNRRRDSVSSLSSLIGSASGGPQEAV